MYNNLFRFISIILLTIATLGCNKTQPPIEIGHLQFVQSSPDLILEKIQTDQDAYVFITTSWCRGGAWTFNNYILPNLNILKEKGTPYFLVYFGEEPRMDFTSDSLKTPEMETIYHVSNNLMDNALVHKMRIESFLKELDESYLFKNSIPVMVCYRNGKLNDCSFYNSDLVNDSEIKLFKKEKKI